MCNLTTPTSSDAVSNNTIDNLMQHADSLYRFALSRVKDHHVAEVLFTSREVDSLDVPAAAGVAGVTAGSAAVLPTRSRQKIRTCLQEHGIKP
jgi:DNA-directed RNA polymerase specialized sigma24 family protein